MNGALNDFESMRTGFLSLHEGRIHQGLETVLTTPINVRPTPLALDVKNRFMTSVSSMPSVELRPAFHGTDAVNHNSIFERGLLIPGSDTGVSMKHGAAHGRGIYTANVDAAWLSRGFCDSPAMLVCAVLQSSMVRHVGDAMVVVNCAHVVPLFIATADSFFFGRVSLPVVPPKIPAVLPSQQPRIDQKPSKTNMPVARKPASMAAKSAKATEKSKFKARLAAQSRRH